MSVTKGILLNLIEKESLQESPTSSIPITKDEATWVSSLICLGALLQGPFTGYLMQRVGRRGAMIIMSLPLFAGWMFIIFASDVWMLYLGRLLSGFAIGSFSVRRGIHFVPFCEVSDGERAKRPRRTHFPFPCEKKETDVYVLSMLET